MVFKAEFDEDIIHRYTHGGCVYLAAEILKLQPDLQTIAIRSDHYALTDGKWVIDIYGIWVYREWHEWWKSYFGKKRRKIRVIEGSWVPSESILFGHVNTDDAPVLASLLFAVYQSTVAIRDRK